MTADKTSQETVLTTGTFQQLTATTEKFVQHCVTEMQRFPTRGDLVEEYRQQGRGAINLWTFLATQVFGVEGEAERRGYSRLRDLLNGATKQSNRDE